METINIASDSDDWRARRLSNFFPDLFILDGATFASVEGFIQGIKFPENHPLRNRAFKEWGRKAKKIGEHACRDLVYFGDNTILYGSAVHREIIEDAIRAKFAQNSGARFALRATDNLTLTHDFGAPEDPHTSLSASQFCRILTTIRTELSEK